MPEDTANSEEQPSQETEGQPSVQADASSQSEAGDPPKQDEQLGESGLKALQSEREARKALEKQLEKLSPLQKIAEAMGGGDAAKGKSEIEQLTERLSSHEQELSTERSARWRAEVAHEKGLTAKQAARLTGSTRDELAADADSLLELFPQNTTRFQGTAESGARKGTSKPSQLTRDDLSRMTQEEISQAQQEGRCDDLLAGK